MAKVLYEPFYAREINGKSGLIKEAQDVLANVVYELNEEVGNVGDEHLFPFPQSLQN